MWLFTADSVLSIVEKGNRGRKLCVRARCADDLDRFRASYCPRLSATTTVGGYDYPFRAYATKRQIGKAIAECVMDIDYSNFKDEVFARHGKARVDVFHDVWADLLALEPPRPLRRYEAWDDWDDVGTWRNGDEPIGQVIEGIFADPEEDELTTATCRVCQERVPILNGDLELDVSDDELLDQIAKLGDEIAAECEFNDTGFHYGFSYVTPDAQIEQVG